MKPPLHVLTLVVTACAFGDDSDVVDLRPYYDNDGVSFVTNLADGDFSFQCSYPAEEMPAPGRCSFGGVIFQFPDYADGLNNCVKLRGKTIDLPDLRARAIYLLGSALYSRHTTIGATLHYADGSSERHLIMLGGGAGGGVKVLETSVFHVQNRIADGGRWPLYVTAIYPQRDVPVDSMVLDDAFTGAQAFAITLSSQAPPGELAETLPPFGFASIDWGPARAGTHRVTASVTAMRDHVSRVKAEWLCLEQTYSETIEIRPGAPRPLSFDCELRPGENKISLTLTDEAGRELVASRRVDIPPLLVVRTEQPIVLDDATPIEVEVLISVEISERAAHGVVLELVTARDGQDTVVVDTSTVESIDRHRQTIAFPAAKTPGGLYHVRARLMRGEQTVAEAKTRAILRRARPHGGVREVRFDDDGMMRVDGKRTFVIGMLANLSEDDVPELANAGANCVMIGGPTMGRGADLWPLFDALHAAGIYVIGGVWPSEDPFHVRQATNLQRQHPAVVGYHFLEEPGGRYCDRPGAIEMIHESALTLRRLDPDHFIDMIDWSAFSYWHYGSFVDVIVTDRYTRGPKPTPNIVLETLRQLREAHEASQHRKPVWNMPQMFSFLVESRQGLSRDPSVPEGPTPQQVRLSGYASIIGGAKGILFFCYGYARNGNSGTWDGRSLWDASKHVLTEITQLRPVLEAVGEPHTVSATEGIETWAKRFDGSWTVVAVNSMDSAVTATLDLRDLDIEGAAETLFEGGRRCHFQDGVITDDFTADGAHVYRIRARGRTP